DYFKRKSIIADGRSYLSFEDIFENENRKNIINKILLDPGIHNNELLRQCNLQKGQLQWHLYVLLKYGIIKKEKFGQYISFFPVPSKIEVKRAPIKLIKKSKTSLKVLDLIEKNPGINSAIIAKKLNMRRSSVKYHVDKLAKLDFIILEKSNREIKLYLNQKDYE
ncbi:MAG: winged helix-turn-helix transcriptional regulator, partial [Promethearchaeota archaeon]